MFTRVGFFEGKIRSGHEADFDRYVRETLLPIWRQTPHALRVEVMREVQADDAAHRFPMVLQIAYPDRKALDEALASPVRALGREATRGLYEFFAGRFFTPSTKLRNQVQRTPRLWPPTPKQSSRRRLNLTRRMTALCAFRPSTEALIAQLKSRRGRFQPECCDSNSEQTRGSCPGPTCGSKWMVLVFHCS